MVSIKILTGSVRPTRFNLQPATWIYEIAKKRKDIKIELVDVKELNLPLLDEPKSPKERQYTKEYTKKWSKQVDATDGFIFVSPEYNHSVSPVLKNAVDFLYHEWSHKPVSFVSYGSLAGGARAVEHMRGVAGELKMYDLREQILLPNYWENVDAKGKYKFTPQLEQEANIILDELIFWATEMKKSRKKLAA